MEEALEIETMKELQLKETHTSVSSSVDTDNSIKNNQSKESELTIDPSSTGTDITQSKKHESNQTVSSQSDSTCMDTRSIFTGSGITESKKHESNQRVSSQSESTCIDTCSISAGAGITESKKHESNQTVRSQSESTCIDTSSISTGAGIIESKNPENNLTDSLPSTNIFNNDSTEITESREGEKTLNYTSETTNTCNNDSSTENVTDSETKESHLTVKCSSGASVKGTDDVEDIGIDITVSRSVKRRDSKSCLATHPNVGENSLDILGAFDEVSKNTSSADANLAEVGNTDPNKPKNTAAKEDINSSSSLSNKEIRTDNKLSKLISEVTKRININDQKETCTDDESCNISNKNTNDSNKKRGRPLRKIYADQSEVRSKTKRRRRCATEPSDGQSNSTGTQGIPSDDVDAEWSLDEKRTLLDALESDFGKCYWNAIAKKVKTKNVQQVKHYTEILRAQANDTTPVHLVGEKDDPLKAWIGICERLRGGQEDIDAKCIPQIMTIAAVEPATSTQESSLGPNYARIYTFLSCILRGQTAAGLTPTDAKVVLELLQSLEIKIMQANILEQQSFLKGRYSSIVKDLEQEQLMFAFDELEKEIMVEEVEQTSENTSCVTDTKTVDSDEEREAKSNNSHTTAKGPVTATDVQTDEMSEPVPSCSSSVAGVEESRASDEAITEKINTSNNIIEAEAQIKSVDGQRGEMSETSESLKPCSIAEVEGQISEMSTSLPSCSNADVFSSRRTRPKRTTPSNSLTESLKSRKESSRKLKFRRLKKDKKKPQLSSLNPVCVPVSLLNIKPKTH